MLKVDVGSLVGVLAFLSATFLAIVVILFNDLDRGLRLDRHLIITRILRLPELLILTTMLGGVLFMVIWGATLEWVWLHQVLWWLAVVVSLVYFALVVLVLIAAVSWLNSEEHSSPWRGSYREEQRLRYLAGHDYARTLLAWREFWQDEKTYVFLGNGHFLPYVKAFLDYLSQIPSTYQAEAETLFSDFIIAMLRMQKRDGVTSEPSLFGCLLIYFEQAYVSKSYQLNDWRRLIQGYLDIMRLQDLAALDGNSPFDLAREREAGVPSRQDFLRENPEFIKNPWRESFEHYLTDDFQLRDARAVRALAGTIRQHYLIFGSREPDEVKKFLRARRRISAGATRRLYSELIKLIDTPDSRSLAKFLISQIKPENCND